MTNQTASSGGKSSNDGLVHAVLTSQHFVLYVTLAFFVFLIPFIPSVATTGNLSNLLSNVWPLLVIAVGQTYVMIVGGIDLSQIAVIAVTSVIGAAVMTLGVDPRIFEGTVLWGTIIGPEGGILSGHAWSMPAAVIVMLAVGGAIGALTGFLIARFAIPAFMMSLIALLFFSAFAVWLTHSENVTNLPASFSVIAERGYGGFLSWSALIAISVAIIAHIGLSRTIFGRWVYATGMNPGASAISGVPVRRVIILSFVVSGVCAAIGSVLYSARLEMGRPAFGDNMNLLLDVVGATVIGGTSLFGGSGKILWTVYGVLLFTLLSNALNLMNLSFFAVFIVKGGVILLAAYLDVWRREAALK
ncbi:ABC transporter permease [Martelella mediterranea]|uniref:ABC transporter permease n=1 Tax=Martelella mediterranea TaxID=293089 RepID=UPI001E2D9D57|nr:ABC transporter permease [Martelella mediterranea]MCD1634801.1 ABC transporter permease [Martelella mediterranea]